MTTTPQAARCLSPLPGLDSHKVLVLGTGGTIASERTAEGYKPLNEATARDAFFKRIRQHPQLSDAKPECFASPVESRKIGRNTMYPPLRTPPLDEKENTVTYEILDMENHMDSSEMTPKGECVKEGVICRTAVLNVSIDWSLAQKKRRHSPSCPSSVLCADIRLEHDCRATVRALGRLRGVCSAKRNGYSGIHLVGPHIPVCWSGQADRSNRRSNSITRNAL